MIIMTVLAISVSYIITPVLTYIHGVTQFAFGKAVKVQHNLSISGEGVTKSSQLATVSIPWTSLYAIDETRSTILFFTNRRCAIMLPRTAFASFADSEGFLAAARTWFRQAKIVAG
ncbi:MAG: YcxB family protein [Asticcacaulis sp.]|uniref:YcxB family protein n=1 Tax=Asticcacaulis sp. TaxID=1872648 RepID=UPI003F7C09A9